MTSLILVIVCVIGGLVSIPLFYRIKRSDGNKTLDATSHWDRVRKWGHVASKKDNFSGKSDE